jgi:hypothetical protein
MFSFAKPRVSLTPRSVKESTSARAAARTELEQALARRDNERARALLADLQVLEPAEPRWPHKLGDLLRAAGRDEEAAIAYRQAGRVYSDRGFGDRSRAMTVLARTLAGRSAPLPNVRPVHPSLRPDSGNLEIPVVSLRIT